MKRLAPLFLASALALSLLPACSGPGAQAPSAPSSPQGTTPPAASQGAGEPSLALPSHHPEETHHGEPSHHPEETHHAEPSYHPEESHHVEPTDHPEEAHHTEPAHHETAAEPSLSLPPDSGAPAGPAAAGVDLQAFYDDLLFDDPDFSASMELSGEYLDQLYPGLSAIATRQCVVYQPMMSAVVCEIALVEAEDAAGAQAVKAVFQARIDAQVGTDDQPDLAWYPASIEAWQNSSRIVSRGNFVMLIAYDKCDDVAAAFEALF